MRAAGIRRYSAPVEPLELPGPGGLRPDEVLLEVRGCGVGNWDEIARTGGWDRVMTHSLPLRGQGAWAEWFVAAAADVATIPDAVPFEVAAALPVPALTADQTLRGALDAGPGTTVLV